MPTRNINLTDHFDQFVSEQITAGMYRNASEVLRAGLRLLELESRAQREKLKLLRKLAREGFDQIDQGAGLEIHGDQELVEAIRELGRRAVNDQRPARK